MNLSIEKINELLENHGYSATKELQYNMFLALLYFSSKKNTIGQDIFATCLEGPPGAGKTFYAEIYQKIASEFFNEDVLLVEYQCDATTGKNELYEDVNMPAAIRRDAEHVIVEGKIVKAIKAVNSGKKVILFIDEYDKAREETDAFLLQFLQSGKINTNQCGDLEIEKQYKNNLQVILCKNDFRENLSGPLARRLRIIRLDYMEPAIFYKVAKRSLIDVDTPVSEGLLNLVSLIYNIVYTNRDLFIRIPSCSEMLLALVDADNLVKYGNAPRNIIYKTLINGLFKETDDIETFESGLKNEKLGNADLKKLIDEMNQEDVVTEESIFDIILRTLFKDSDNALKKKEEELQKEIEEVNARREELLKMMEEMSQFEMQPEENRQIRIGDAVVDIKRQDSDIVSNFDEEDVLLKRGKSIFEASSDEFFSIGGFDTKKVDNKSLQASARKNKLVVYENGIQLLKTNSTTFVMTRKNLSNQRERVNLMTDSIIINGKSLSTVIKLLEALFPQMSTIELNALVATMGEKDNFFPVKGLDNVFNITTNDLKILARLESSMSDSECKAISDEIMNKR